MNSDKFSLIILSLDGKHKPLNCSLPHETVIVKTKGWGLARHKGISASKHNLIVMLNADVEPHPSLWKAILKCKPNEFYMTRYGEGPCSQIFVIHRQDYEKIKFNQSLKHIFEDGEFYVRATNFGLKCEIIPSSLYIHKPHYHDFLYNPRKSFFLDFEYSRMFAKYKYHVRRNLIHFFIQPWCIKRIPNMITRLLATEYYIIKGAFKHGQH